MAKNEEGENGVEEQSGGGKMRSGRLRGGTERRLHAGGAGNGGGETGEGGTESVAIMTENCALPGSAAQHRHLIQFNCDTVQ